MNVLKQSQNNVRKPEGTIIDKENLDALNKPRQKQAVFLKNRSEKPRHFRDKKISKKVVLNSARAKNVQKAKKDPQFVQEFTTDIFEHIFEKEVDFQPKGDYMGQQDHINPVMREILVDWLSDVTVKFRLLSETLFMAVNLIDRYLSIKSIMRDRLQLLGITTLFIASKYEEIYPPQLKEYLRVCDRTFSKNELLEMEADVINGLNFKLTHSSSLRFLERFGLVGKLPHKQHLFARYLLELGLTSYGLVKFKNSKVAAASVYLVNKIFRNEEWSISLQTETRCSLTEVRKCAKQLYIVLYSAENSQYTAVRRKFCSKKLMEVGKYKIEFCKQIRQ